MSIFYILHHLSIPAFLGIYCSMLEYFSIFLKIFYISFYLKYKMVFGIFVRGTCLCTSMHVVLTYVYTCTTERINSGCCLPPPFASFYHSADVPGDSGPNIGWFWLKLAGTSPMNDVFFYCHFGPTDFWSVAKNKYIYIYTFICALLIGLQKLVSGWYLPIIHALCTWCESKLPDKKLLGPIKLWQWWFGPCPSQSGYDWVGLKISGPIGQSLNGPAVWPSMTVYVISRDLL